MKKYNGITLISLIITIIILLILSVVTIGVLNKNEILKTAHDAKELYSYQSAREILDLKLAEIEMQTWSQKQQKATFEDIIEALSDEREVNIIIKEYSPVARVELTSNIVSDLGNVNINSISDITIDIHKYLFKITNDKSVSYLGKIGVNGIHIHNFSYIITKEQTCTEDGIKTYTCSECNESYTEVIPKLGHICNTYENIQDPTCTENGLERAVCEVCNENCDREIPALGHLQAEEYSYSSVGHYHCCTRCGEAMEQEEAHTNNSNCTICGYTGNFTVSYNLYRLSSSNLESTVSYGSNFSTTLTPENSLAYERPKNIIITMGGNVINTGYTYNNVNGSITISNITGNIVITASASNYSDNTCFTNALATTTQQSHIINITQAYQIRVYSFVPETSGNYKFYTNDAVANTRQTDDYVYLYSSTQGKSLEIMDNWALNYATTGSFNDLHSNCLVANDDGGEGYNFSVTYNCTAGVTYYIAVRTYTPSYQQRFDSLHIQKN